MKLKSCRETKLKSYVHKCPSTVTIVCRYDIHTYLCMLATSCMILYKHSM